jgi:hypothetical protein
MNEKKCLIDYFKPFEPVLRSSLTFSSAATATLSVSSSSSVSLLSFPVVVDFLQLDGRGRVLQPEQGLGPRD